MLTRHKMQRRVMTAGAVVAWLGGVVIVAGDPLGAWGVIATLPLLLLMLAAAVTMTAVVCTAQFLGAAVARETAAVLMHREQSARPGDGRVIQFRR